jgi:hypothetical protein
MRRIKKEEENEEENEEEKEEEKDRVHGGELHAWYSQD